MHLIFYDGSCPFCNFWVATLLKMDREGIFRFASLQGKTARIELKGQIRDDTLVLLENYGTAQERVLLRSKALFRIVWLLGGVWGALGVGYFLPAFCFDWAYRLVARNRFRLMKRCKKPSHPGRFLD